MDLLLSKFKYGFIQALARLTWLEPLLQHSRTRWSTSNSPSQIFFQSGLVS